MSAEHLVIRATVIGEITAERRRQIEEEGWSRSASVMTTPDKAREITEKLTKAQREVVAQYSRPDCIPALLVQLGLFKQCGHCDYFHRTPLGLQVRDYLNRSKGNGCD